MIKEQKEEKKKGVEVSFKMRNGISFPFIVADPREKKIKKKKFLNYNQASSRVLHIGHFSEI